MKKALLLAFALSLFLFLASCASISPSEGFTYKPKVQKLEAKDKPKVENKSEEEKVSVKAPKLGKVYSREYKTLEVKKRSKTTAGGSIDLHFENVPLSEVLKEVFGKVLGVSYVLSQDINNPVTLHLNGVSKEQAVRILKDILVSLGYMTVVDNGVIKVLPTKSKPFGGNVSALVFSPQYVDAEALGKVVSGFLSPVGKVVVSGKGVLIVDDLSRLRLLKGFLEEIDAPFYRGKMVTFIKTKLPPKKVKDNVERILALLGKEDKGSVIESLDDLGMVVVVTRDKRLFNDIQDWIELMEKEEGQESLRLYILRLNYAEAKTVADLLNRLRVLEEISEVGVRKGEGAKAVAQKPETTKKAEASGESKKRVKPQSLEEILIKSKSKKEKKKRKSVSGSIVADENTNSLIIKATPFQYRVIKNFVKEIDRVPKQVLIEMVVAEVSLGDTLKYGIEGLLKGFIDSNYFTVETAFGLAGKSSTLTGFKGIIFNSQGDIRGILNFLDSKTSLKVLSAPHILTKDNEEAVIEVGAEVPILSEQLVSTVGGVPSVSNSIQYRPTGIILKVKPIISNSGTVTLRITEEVSDAIPNNISPELNSPIITKRSATTTLLLKDGQIALLGGIIQNRFEDSKQGVPGVSKMFLLGDLFSSRDKSASTTELIVLIRASVLESPEENDEVVSSFRNKLKRLKELIQEQSTE